MLKLYWLDEDDVERISSLLSKITIRDSESLFDCIEIASIIGNSQVISEDK